LYGALSAESSRSRFHGGWISPAVASRLARVDPDSAMACVIASVPGDAGYLAAEARYVPLTGDRPAGGDPRATGAVPASREVAEIGITVADDYQGTGLGGLLLGCLVRRAGESGFRRLRALVSLANGAMLHVLEPYGWVLTEPTDLSVACLEISAVGGRPGWPQQTEGQKVLVEQRGFFDSGQVAAMRAAGADIRHCAGPRRPSGRTCPLLTSGRCRLAEEADLILPMLAGDDADYARVLAAHRMLWPDRLAS
jgi:GNAT superfamily N-acetyltransferase